MATQTSPLQQAKQLLSQLIDEQERIDGMNDAMAKAASEALDLSYDDNRFEGESFMFHYLKNLRELLEKIENN